jgi:peptidoglycan-associated lipoprotein
MKINYKFLIFSLIFSFFISNSLQAQRKNRVTKKADDAFAAEMYFEASELYKKGYKKTKNKAIKSEIQFKQAECYRYQNKYKKAALGYKKAIKANYDNGNPIAIYWYAKMLMSNGNYEKALEQFKKYQKKSPKDKRAEASIISCQFAINWLENPTRYAIAIWTNGDKLNPKKQNSKSSDFSPAYGNRDYTKIYFVSSRPGSSNDRIDERTGEFFYDIYSSELNKKGHWSKPKAVESPINTDHHEGALCLNQNGTTMFFTTCQSENKKELGCEISISVQKGTTWQPLNKLEVIVDSNTTIGHPTISPDEKQIIFSADMEGGWGGNDLWMVTKVARGQWSKPANLGPNVNTPGDEMFPFLHNDGSLYFSSDRHAGMGGFDIFKSELDENGLYTKKPINLKYPINSSADDFGWIVERNTEKGFFTSNRKFWTGNDGVQNKTNGSDNIYMFKLPPLILTLQGVVTDTKTGAVVTGATVKLVGDDDTALELKTDNTGSYNFELSPLTTYEIVVTREGYLNKKVTETTVGIEVDTDLVKDINIDPIFKDIRLPRIYYDFAKWNLRDTSKLDLDRVYNIMIENPEVVIELNSHTDFRGDNLSNMELSQNRANECINYLIQKGIASDRMIPNGKGESEPYIITKEDEETYKRRGLFKKKIFKVGQILTEDYINGLKKDEYKEIAHQFNRRTTFNVISQSYDPEFEKLFRNSIQGGLPEINQIKSHNNIADFVWHVENDADFPFIVYYNGLSGGTTIIPPRETKSILLIPGAYRIVGKHKNNLDNITPFSGTRLLEGGNEASTRFFIIWE